MSELNDGGYAFPWGEHGTRLGGLTIRAEYTGKRGELTALGKKYGVSRVSIKHYVSGRYR